MKKLDVYLEYSNSTVTVDAIIKMVHTTHMRGRYIQTRGSRYM